MLKIFYHVDKDILLTMLQTYGGRGTACSLVDIYLSHYDQYLHSNEKLSDVLLITVDTP